MADKGYARSAVKSGFKSQRRLANAIFALGETACALIPIRLSTHPCRIKFSWPCPPFSRMNSPATYSFSNSEYTASGAPFAQNLKNAQGESGWRKTQPVGEAG
nr:hypothetical protein [uncultured Ottowia sp.]